jgi:hypothetical protein
MVKVSVLNGTFQLATELFDGPSAVDVGTGPELLDSS